MNISILQPSADLTFLALTVWREARGESYDCKLAVAYSILQRVKLRRWYGDTITEVIFKKWQYSSMTAPRDPNLVDWPKSDDQSWIDSLGAAQQAVQEKGLNPAPGADSYFSANIAPPDWALPADFILQIDHIRFYDLNRDYESEHLAGH